MTTSKSLHAHVVGAGAGLAPGVGDAGGIHGELGQALAPSAEGAVLVRAVWGAVKLIDRYFREVSKSVPNHLWSLETCL